MKLRIWVTGDEGRPMGVRKMTKMGKNGKYWKNRQKWYKMIKKNYRVLNFLLKYNAPILHPPHYAGKK